MIRKSLFHSTVLSAILPIAVLGCSSGQQETMQQIDPTQPATVQAALRDTAERSPVSDEDKAALALSSNAFALDMFATLRANSSPSSRNIFFSPMSIMLGMSMAYAGAEGSTADELRDGLHISLPKERFFSTFHWLSAELNRRAADALAFERRSLGQDSPLIRPEDFRLQFVASLWGDQSVSVERPFMDTLTNTLGASANVGRFQSDPEGERLNINRWVSDQTNNRIEGLLPPGSIVSTTRTVIVNALHLSFPWQKPFASSSTREGTFKTSDGTTVQTPFMSDTGLMSYAETATYRAVAVPLYAGAIDFVVVMPNELSLEAFESSLSPRWFDNLTESLRPTSVALALPKLAVASPCVRLRDSLESLGVRTAFTPDADFTGITRSAKIFIQDVYHKTVLGVDERGVEASAATAVGFALLSAPVNPKPFNVNRPFFFVIRDRPTNTLLFAGHIVNPSGATQADPSQTTR